MNMKSGKRNPGKVLIVDDEIEVLQSLHRQLNREFNVVTVNSGEEALTLLKAYHFDVIISDQRMPGLSGTDLLTDARVLNPNSTRILLTGYSDQQALIDAVNRADIHGYMPKPWDLIEIRTTIRDAVEASRLRASNKRLLHKLEKVNKELEQRVNDRTRELEQALTITRKAECKARESEQRFRLLANVVPVGILRCDVNGQVQYVNPYWEKIISHTLEQLSGFDWLEHISIKDKERVRQCWRDFINGQKDEFEENVNLNRGEDVGDVFISIRAMPIYNEEKAIEGYIISASDLTRIQQLQNELSQALSMEKMARAVGGVAHEFNNLYTVVFGSIELARNELKTTKSVTSLDSHLEKILQFSDKGHQIVRQLINYAFGSKKSPSTLSISDFLIKFVHQLECKSANSIHLDIPSIPIPSIRFNVDDLNLVMIELIANAFSAMNEQGVLHLCAGIESNLQTECAILRRLVKGEWVFLSVIDNGHGIDEKNMQKVLDPFFTTKDVGEGKGLGLSVVAGVLRQYDCHLTIDSIPEVKTRFRILFPLHGT